MTVDVFQHVPFEDLGAIRGWLDERGARIRYTRCFAGDPIPAIEDIEALIVLGGPMSVNDEDTLPWLEEEKQRLREAMTRGVPVLGICLGAQLIANALGSRVYPHTCKEIGWFPIRRAPAPASVPPTSSAFEFPIELMVFHWHGDTFDLPDGAVRLASSAACENQAFQIGDRTIGVQFHLEMTPESLATMIDHGRDELTPAPYVESEARLRATPASHYRPAQDTLHALLEHVLGEDRGLLVSQRNHRIDA